MTKKIKDSERSCEITTKKIASVHNRRYNQNDSGRVSPHNTLDLLLDPCFSASHKTISMGKKSKKTKKMATSRVEASSEDDIREFMRGVASRVEASRENDIREFMSGVAKVRLSGSSAPVDDPSFDLTGFCDSMGIHITSLKTFNREFAYLYMPDCCSSLIDPSLASKSIRTTY